MPAGQLLGSSGIGGELDRSREAAVVRTNWRERGREEEMKKESCIAGNFRGEEIFRYVHS